MTKRRSTKSALLISGLAMLLCLSMLVGSTFAWFTDTVTSSGNKIVAGTLDVELWMHDGTEYVNISESTDPIFGEGSIAQNNNAQTVWEPGKTQVAYLQIKNNGNLALKYTVSLNVKNVEGDLYEVMQYAIVPDAKGPDGVTVWDSTAGKSVVEGKQSVSDTVSLEVGESHYFALAIHMNEEATNEYQGGKLNFDVTVLATQFTYENDSFNDQYDAGAEYPTQVIKVASAEELSDSLLSNDDTPIVFIRDIDDYSGTVYAASDVELNGYSLRSKGIGVRNDLNMSNGTLSMRTTSGYLDIRPTESETYTFTNVDFVNEYKRKANSNTGSDRIEYMVKLYPEASNVKSTFIFENCIFENASVYFGASSSNPADIDVTFKNCTFNAMMGSDAVIEFSSNVTGTVKIEGCTFNIEGTYANNAVIDIKTWSNTTLDVTATNNTLNANKAVPYTYDPTKGETEVDSVKIGNVSSVRNYCLFDCLTGNYSTIVETGTILKGDIAIASK